MNLDRAFLLFLASVGAVSGFAPGMATSRLMAANTAQLMTRVASSLLSEATDTSESAGEAVAAAAEEPAAPEYDTSIYIGNISFDSTEDQIRNAFAAHGEIKKITMPTDKFTGRPRGFAFVQMADADATAAAISALNESDFNGSTIYVSESLPKDQVEKKSARKRAPRNEEGTKIYVGNLNFETTAEALENAFKEYGNVIECFMPVDFDGNPRGFAFVSMEEETALKAIEGLNQKELDGRTLTVNKSLPRGQKSENRKTQTKLYVGNLSWGTEEGALRELFEEYGTVVDCYIPVDRETGQHRGFAFVTMEPEDALRAADETDGYELDGRILRVNEAQPKGGFNRQQSNDGYDGGDAYDEQSDESWGNDAY